MNMDQRLPDRTFVVWVAIVMMAAAAGPDIVGQSLTPAGYLFQGNTILAPGDPNVYYSYIEQARQGAILMRDVFTSEPQAATLWQPVWLVLGWLANLLHITTPAVFALGRVLSAGVFVLTAWWAAGWVWPDRTARRIATLLMLGATGLGGVIAWLSGMNFGLMLELPPDLWVSEMVPILSGWATPHFLLVTSGFLFVLLAVERSWQEKSWSLIGWAGLVSLLTLSVHPFHILTWTLLWAGLTVWRWVKTKSFPIQYLARWLTVLFLSLPAIFYYAVGLLADPIVQGRAIQNINLTSSWWKVLVGLGGLGVLAAIGAWRMRRVGNRQLPWLIGWAIVQLVVIFLPFNGQRRLIQGLVIPFALLAVPAVMALWRRWRVNRAKQAVLFIGLIGLLTASTIMTGGWIIRDYYQERQGRDHWEYFLSPEYQQLFSFVKTLENNRPILASAWDSVLIAGLTGRTVVSGHPVETLDYQAKNTAVKSFYTDADKQKQAQIIERYRACYILAGPRERAYGSGFEPAQWLNLTIAWSGPTMTLYRVTDCLLAK